MANIGSILDHESIVEPITDPASSKERLDEYLNRLHMKIYPLGLYLGFLEGVGILILILVRFFNYGLNDPDQIEVAGKGQTSVIAGYLAMTQIFVFWAGITAKSANDYSEQNRFLTFLRVYLQLLFMIWLFLLLGFWAIDDATKGSLIFFCALEFGNLIFFGALYISGFRFNSFLKKNEGRSD
jgi:hypothetical protein